MTEENVNEAADVEAVEVEQSEQEVQDDQEVQASEDAPETQEELKDAVDEAIEEGATKEEVAQMIKEFQLKVNGKTLTKKIDLSDEEALTREFQMAAAGRQSMQEAAELKKLFASEIERMKNDPYAVLEELGLNPDELAEARIQSRIEEMKKSPEQIEQENLQKELTELREKLANEEKRAQEAEMSRLQEKAAVQLDEEIASALEQHKSLPNSQYTVKKIADVMLWALDNGLDDVTVQDVLPTVEKDIKDEFNRFMEDLPEDMLETYIGKRATEKLRQKRLNAAKKVEGTNSIKKTGVKEKKEAPKQRVKIDDWMRS